MRIGHQIYNYLYDHIDSGRTNIVPTVKINTIEGTLKGNIYECHINWAENQVYIGVVTPTEKLSLSVHEFLKWMGGSSKPQSYKPLYQLRDQLKTTILRNNNHSKVKIIYGTV